MGSGDWLVYAWLEGDKLQPTLDERCSNEKAARRYWEQLLIAERLKNEGRH